MRGLFLSILPVLVWGQSYPEVIAGIDRSFAVQSAEQLETAALEFYRAAEGRHLPSLDAQLSAIKLNRTPTVTFGPSTMQMGTRHQVAGELALTYPLFSGFAITASVEKAKLAYEKAALQSDDVKRNLYLNATRLYASAAAYDTVIAAAEEAKKAMDDAYAKAKGLHQNGLLAPSALYAIEAKGYEIEARLAESRTMRARILNQLAYLADIPVTNAVLPDQDVFAPGEGEIEQIALSGREDLLALGKALGMSRSDVTLAQSKWYPNFLLSAALKRQGDDLGLSGDGYTNADKSYAGIVASWNLYSGMSDWHTLQASKAAELSALSALEDYKRRIGVEIHNTRLEIEGTQSKLLSARMQIKASEEYMHLTRGRFEHQLSSADELSRSIADLAAAKADAAVLESELFTLRVSLWLQGGLEAYRNKVLNIIAL